MLSLSLSLSSIPVPDPPLPPLLPQSTIHTPALGATHLSGSSARDGSTSGSRWICHLVYKLRRILRPSKRLHVAPSFGPELWIHSAVQYTLSFAPFLTGVRGAHSRVNILGKREARSDCEVSGRLYLSLLRSTDNRLYSRKDFIRNYTASPLAAWLILSYRDH